MWDLLQYVFGVQALKNCFCDSTSAWAWACIISINIFMNLVKRSLKEKRTRDGIGVSRGVGVLVRSSLLLTLNPLTGP